ncbi:MAG: flagellar basal body-associated FliL family protein [Proteobacteria bacterium]|nr:flagellar basal body-associated FliL family protein [Pseudomonadota bacterium]
MLKWIIIGAVSLGIVAAAVGGGLYFFHGAETVKKKPQPPPVIGTLWPMEPYIVNLRDNNGERYLKVALQLEMSNPELLSELNLLKPKLRDSTLDLLSAKTYQELQEFSGKQKLREDIMIRLNSFLTSGKIVRIYFTDFVIQ